MSRAFSVVISVYRGDHPVHFRQAFDSILTQNTAAQEIILAVDGPIGDELSKAVTHCGEQPSVKVLWLKENVGRGAARHQAILATSTSIVAVMDSDDICTPNRFELELNAMGSADVVGGYIAEFEEIASAPRRIRKVPLSHEEIVKRGRWLLPFNHVTIMFSKEAYLRVGGYRSLKKVEDYDLFHRMVSGGLKFVNIPEVVVLVRTSQAQYSRRQGLAYFREEILLYNNMLTSGYIGRGEWWRNVLIRTMVRFMPTAIFRMISRNWLRARNG